jgi:hypothetical protein
VGNMHVHVRSRPATLLGNVTTGPARSVRVQIEPCMMLRHSDSDIGVAGPAIGVTTVQC